MIFLAWTRGKVRTRLLSGSKNCLRSMYKMDGDQGYIFQQDEIADVMAGAVGK
jgi:hypothetical protein